MLKVKNDIEVTGLTKIFRGKQGQVTALDNVSWQVKRGSFHALLGMNGAGKSTLIGSLAGLVKPNCGVIKICGYDSLVATKEARSCVGFVPQEPNFDIFFSPLATLRTQAGLFGLRSNDQQLKQILATVGLLDKADVQARKLSAGMRRRLSIAKALVHQPQLLILDEPTVGVDVELREQMLGYFRNLNAQGYTVVLTTHYLEEAEQLCDTVTIIHQGKIVVSTEKNQLLREHSLRIIRLTLQAKITPALMTALSSFKVSKINNYQLDLRLEAKELLQPLLEVISKEGNAVRDVQSDVGRKLEEVLRYYASK